MISVDFHPKAGTRAEVRKFDSFVTLQIEGGSQALSIFGNLPDLERFEQIAALFNEGLEAIGRPWNHTPAPAPAELAGDYLGDL